MNRSRRVLVQVVAALAAMPLTALGQGSAKQWRIRYLTGGPRPADARAPAALRTGLAEFGYTDGRNAVFEPRWAQGEVSRLPALAAELIASHVDVVVVIGFPATLAVQRASRTVPIVTVSAGDAIGVGLVQSLSHPGGNLTGISDMAIELAAKRVEVLKDTVPKASRLAVLWNQNDLGMTLRYQQIETAGRALGINIQALAIKQPEDFDAAFT